MMPTADHIAIAIIAACRETGADPEQVAMGATNKAGRHGDHSITHARAYAALALAAVFDCGRPAIARMVGSRHPNAYMSGLDFARKRGDMRWWDDAAFMRVVTAVETIPLPRLKLPTLYADPILPKPRRPLGACLTEELMGDPAPARSALGLRDGK